MPLLRSGSARSTLSMMQRKTHKYQKFLNLSNVFLLITSTILIFSAIILMKFYHIDKLDFWSAYFYVVPIFMITLGVYTFLVCIYGFLISGSESRGLIASFAILLTLAFLAQCGSIFTSLELRTVVAQGAVGSSTVNKDLVNYGVVPSITNKWDSLQRDLHCCGGNNFLTGYTDYRNTPIGANSSVPDSCCHIISQDCGKNIFNQVDDQIRNDIFVDGCLTVLMTKLEDDVIPMLVVYACVGVVLALVELITVVLASAYVAQITRRMSREDNHWRTGDAGRSGSPGHDEADQLNHETVC